MKELSQNQMESIKGGGFSNRLCMQLGLITIGFGIAQVWPVSGGALTTATVGGCFDYW